MNLDRLLSPRSIVTIGGAECERVVEECERLGFAGEITSIHPKLEHMAGRACLRSLSQLTQVPDAAFVAVPNIAAVEVVRELAARGCGGAVVYSAGFAEAGHAELQAALIAAAGDTPVVGPNCYGLIDTGTGAALWPDVHGCHRSDGPGVALVTQSSNVAINLTMQRRGLPIRRVLTAGNSAMVGIADLARAALEDPDVRVLAMHLEGIGDPQAFADLAMASSEAGKPIVVLKAGRSEAAAAAAHTHTASLAGGHVAHDAFFHRLGVAAVTTLEALLETAKLLLAYGPLAGPRVMSMSCSGGEAALVADAGARHGLDFPPLGDAGPGLADALGPRVALANPLDYHTFVWSDPAGMRALFEAARMVEADIALLVLDWPRDAPDADLEGWRFALQAFREVFAGRPAAVLATLPENMDEEAARRMIATGIAPLAGLETGMEAIAAARVQHCNGWTALPTLRDGGSHLWTERQAKVALAAAGVVVPRGETARSADAAIEIAARLNYPLVAKSLGLAHKTEVGAVRLRLQDASAVRSAAVDLLQLGDEILIEEMATRPGVELLVGISRDPVIGPVLTIGAGGVLAELLADTATLVLPVDDAELRDALASLRVARLLDGWRGADAVDMDALVANILCIAQFAGAHADTLVELDVNPLIATAYGAVAVDALIVSKAAPPEDGAA